MSIQVHGIDTGAHFGFATFQESGELVRLRGLDKPDKRKPRAGKPATKKRPAVEPDPGLETWETWAVHLHGIHNLLLDIVEPGDVVAIEDVRRHQGTDAAHAYGRVLGVVEDATHTRGARLVLVGVGKAKQAATGYGRAEKEDMIRAAKAKWGEEYEWTEHLADAAWVGECARRGEE